MNIINLTIIIIVIIGLFFPVSVAMTRTQVV